MLEETTVQKSADVESNSFDPETEQRGRVESFLLNLFGVGFAVLAGYVTLTYAIQELNLMKIIPESFAAFFFSNKTEFVGFIAAGIIGPAVAFYWEIKKPAAARLSVYQYWYTAVIRYFLAYIFLTYGFAKVFKDQFSTFLSTMDTPVGQLSGIELTWRFFGYSYAYALFIASSQIISSILLFFRKTTILAAVILMPVISNIVFVNFSHHIPVKLYSSVYLLMTLYLLSQDFHRLKALLWDNRPFGKPAFPLSVWKKSYIGWIAKAAVIFVIFSSTIGGNYYNYASEMKVTTPLYGAWKVQDFKVNEQPGDPKSPIGVWQKIYFESDTFISIKKGPRRASLYTADIGQKDNHLTLKGFRDAKTYFEGSYQLAPDGTLSIMGKSGGDSIQATLQRDNNSA